MGNIATAQGKNKAVMPWFRMYSEFATDPKVQMLSEVDQRRFVMLLCLRCSNGDVTLHDDEIAFQLRISSEEWAETKRRLQAKNLIDDDNLPTSWDKRQYRSDSSKERVSRHRERKKQEAQRSCNVTVTPPDTETDTDTERVKQLTDIPERCAHDVGLSDPPDDLKSAFNGSTGALLELVTTHLGNDRRAAEHWLGNLLAQCGATAVLGAYQQLLTAKGTNQPIARPIQYLSKTAASLKAQGGAAQSRPARMTAQQEKTAKWTAALERLKRGELDNVAAS